VTFKIPFSLTVDKQCRGAIAKPFWQVLNCPNRIGRDEKTNLHFAEDRNKGILSAWGTYTNYHKKLTRIEIIYIYNL